jgi:hypothetical protein
MLFPLIFEAASAVHPQAILHRLRRGAKKSYALCLIVFVGCCACTTTGHVSAACQLDTSAGSAGNLTRPQGGYISSRKDQ